MFKLTAKKKGINNEEVTKAKLNVNKPPPKNCLIKL